MNKAFALELLRLLSALESWSFSTGKPLPEYLLDRITAASEGLEQEILKC